LPISSRARDRTFTVDGTRVTFDPANARVALLSLPSAFSERRLDASTDDAARISIIHHSLTSGPRMFERLIAVATAALLTGAVGAQTLDERFAALVDAQGVSSQEGDVRESIRAQLPSWAKTEVDNVGNLRLTIGTGAPQTVLVAALDEYGYVVSRVTDDGYLRLHRHVPATTDALRDQFMVGQPVVIRTSTGTLVPGVTSTPSVHLRRLSNQADVTRIKEVDDLWIDVGASNPAGVERLGIRILDGVNLRERVQPLANGRVAGINTQLRGGAQALVELVRGIKDPSNVTGSMMIVWTAQSMFNERGLARLAASLRPQQIHLVGALPNGPATLPMPWSGVPVTRWSVPVLYADTPVEVVETKAIRALAHDLATRIGIAFNDDPTVATTASSTARTKASPASRNPQMALLKSLIESYGVSGHEGPVRDVVAANLPAWAKAVTDDKGNLTVSFGHGEPELLFVAHLDEIGFEIGAVRPDGTAGLRERGGMYLSLYEAHPVWVHVGARKVPAIIAPRARYASAATSQPEAGSLTLYFGTESAAETTALGVAAGQSVTVRKQFVELAAPRATGRAVDDRAGIAALLLALKRINPDRVERRVTIAFSVEEETGLAGARALAARFHPQYAIAIDTFVSTDTPADPTTLAHTPLGQGAVVRGMDNSMATPAETIDRIAKIARDERIPLQIGVTQGGIDSSTFSAAGAIDVGLSWPGRYSHSPVEVIDQRDLDALTNLVVALIQRLQ
jgi:putative aminopeptidase FrvX